ncbi:small GTP-binding domain protein [Sphingomonas sp. S17]|uniref:tRNA modification GTPase MnmE n=2 Tax=Sphingomonas paucimobilis TaxID=13689 RepID=A0A411LKR2_SPHPI|nr:MULTISPECIES: tRNA uridine-5-carboxymethylaminomethyl(34) synthesis GTPase MnmE [Sphingomonas]EGI55087.1 small GTP-binding domain protein [Sphingomonas sp. S17]MBQ1480587.1 tRNA uridine-5-carboxymethylaminomethyl(34) synthesis GTPase MnmE [Sphingomonas sp.]MCM3680488.1 tRNA uridine-5-carboxymethylaminomethyl(34) synthesis GTPase MnmE [Sphingomonas paucimobilis]MDG5970096.1 tRNA uridine-5-carboxymethylaminomethyl(34) synthesis GTPase MnmE [Sphingomonas paucimobilis]NNG57339.1 tRNA uridine-5-
MADTIFAVSSGQPPAAIAVIRVSGPQAFAATERLAGRLPKPRRAGLRRLRDAAGETLDSALVLSFPGPATATGEDLVELHCHGGRAVVAAVEGALAAQPGVRHAEPGEFTRRALTHGRIDLAEAEGLADLLEAQTERQRRAAIGAVEGQVSQALRGWMDRTATLSAAIEAMLDFAEEDDVPLDAAALAGIRGEMDGLAQAMLEVVDRPPVDRLHDGIRVVLAGPPNSGKSTLLNLLTEREAAIVSPIAGTTRDRIEASVLRGGIAYVLTDTAGLAEDTDDVIEAIGITRAQEAIDQADILLWLADTPPPREDALWLHSRADVPGREGLPAGRQLAVRRDDGASIAALWHAVAERAASLLPREDAVGFKRHQQDQCRLAAQALLAAPKADALLMAEELRVARQALAGLLGVSATETMLDALFGRFCLGK